eukprot:COSAG03_NODE_6841_length_997_cov_1.993318_1_plen_149_part_00
MGFGDRVRHRIVCRGVHWDARRAKISALADAIACGRRCRSRTRSANQAVACAASDGDRVVQHNIPRGRSKQAAPPPLREQRLRERSLVPLLALPGRAQSERYLNKNLPSEPAPASSARGSNAIIIAGFHHAVLASSLGLELSGTFPRL